MDEPLPPWAGILMGLLGLALVVLGLFARGHWQRTRAARRAEGDRVLKRFAAGELSEMQCLDELRKLRLTPDEIARIWPGR